MKKNIQKLLCGFLALVMVFSLSGCKNEPVDEMKEDPAAVTTDVQEKDKEVKPEKETGKAEKETEDPKTETEATPEKPAETKEENQEETTKPTTSTNPSTTTKPTEAPKATEAPKPTSPTTTTAPTTPTVHTHSYSKKVTPPTCTAEGYTTYNCSCGDSYTGDKVAAKGHSYSETVTAPTCTAGGYTTVKCSVCGDKYTNNKTSATGHSWGDWETTKEATQNAEGEKQRTCSACGAVETAVIEKLPAETIDLRALEAYGRSYGASTYGFNPDSGCYAGYYPAYTCYFFTMEEGKAKVREKVDSDASALLALGPVWGENEDGSIWRANINIGIRDNGNNSYTIYMYYG